MKNITKKTEKERQENITEKRISIKDTLYFYYVCENCKTAFFGLDEIIEDSNGYIRCPNIVSSLFRKDAICKNQMYGGSEETFNKYYKINEN